MNKLKIFLAIFVVVGHGPLAWAKVGHVVLISFDGLRPDAISKFENKLPNFRRVIREGASTLNALTDVHQQPIRNEEAANLALRLWGWNVFRNRPSASTPLKPLKA